MVGALLLGSFGVSLDQVLISTAMPTVVGQIGGLDIFSWVFAGYLMASSIVVPVYGRLADIYGRKTLLLVSTAIFLTGSALCASAQSMEQLIAFRVLQGVGGGGLWPLIQTLIGDLFTLRERPKVMSTFSTSWTMGALLGPAIGGILAEQLTWRAVFLVNLPVGLVFGLSIWLFLREPARVGRARIDIWGAVLLATSAAFLLLGLNPARVGGQSLPQLPLLVAAVVLGALFVRHELRFPEPLVELGLFRDRTIAVGSVASILAGGLIFSQPVFMPSLLQGAMGLSPTIAGLVIGASTLAIPVTAFLAARMMLERGFRFTGVIGSGVAMLGFLAFATFGPDTPLGLIVVTQFLTGVGFGFAFPTLTVSIQHAVGWSQRGVVTSISQFSRTMGGSIAVSLLGGLFSAAVLSRVTGEEAQMVLSAVGSKAIAADQIALVRDVLTDSLRVVFVAMAGMTAVMLVTFLRMPGGRPSEAEVEAETPTALTEVRQPASTV
jgi:EmrB/QacA subfamily drug resistance transporter